jgi:UDP-N-acetylglucosamine 2-epimerase (non-hydrolysing)
VIGVESVPSRPGVMVVVGTRPEAIKLAPVVSALRARRGEAECRVVFTGQHTDLADRAAESLGMVPDHDLDIMRESQSLYDVGNAVMAGLRELVRLERPSILVVQGDTATVFFATLVGFFEKIPVAHVEAGLRTGDRWAPWPEEMFRRLTDHASELHFAPTRRAMRALADEGIGPRGVHLTGNTVVDALLAVAAAAGEVAEPTAAALLARRDQGPLALLTAHRRESHGAPLESVFRAVESLADRHPELQVLFPVHPNPAVSGPAARILGGHPRIHLAPPLDYADLVQLLSRVDLVLTDSGGIQEEAPTFGVPVLILREVTERPEAVEAGVAERVGTDASTILEAGERALAGWRERRLARGALHPSPFGDGRAGERIADILIHRLTGAPRLTQDWSGT